MTHTIRNKTKAIPTITFNPKFFLLLCKESDWVNRVVISHLLKSLTVLTGKKYVLDYAQETLLNLNSRKSILAETTELRMIFVDGLSITPLMSPDQVLRVTRDFEEALNLFEIKKGYRDV